MKNITRNFICVLIFLIINSFCFCQNIPARNEDYGLKIVLGAWSYIKKGTTRGSSIITKKYSWGYGDNLVNATMVIDKDENNVVIFCREGGSGFYNLKSILQIDDNKYACLLEIPESEIEDFKLFPRETTVYISIINNDEIDLYDPDHFFGETDNQISRLYRWSGIIDHY